MRSRAVLLEPDFPLLTQGRRLLAKRQAPTANSSNPTVIQKAPMAVRCRQLNAHCCRWCLSLGNMAVLTGPALSLGCVPRRLRQFVARTRCSRFVLFIPAQLHGNPIVQKQG